MNHPIYLLLSVFHNLCEDPRFLSAQSLSKQFPCFLFTDLFGTKGQFDGFPFFWKMWQQRKNIVALSGSDEIACRNKDCM